MEEGFGEDTKKECALLTTSIYLDFLCTIGYKAEDPQYMCRQGANLLDFNYPSITVPNLMDSVTVTPHTQTQERWTAYDHYKAHYRSPMGVY